VNWRTLSGYGLLIIGIAGCLLPIIPGFPFLIAAAAILGWDHWAIKPWAKHLRRFKPDAGADSVRSSQQSPPAP
jgi:uncharacterized membrane protein YbaN (DUF454 family)